MELAEIRDYFQVKTGQSDAMFHGREILIFDQVGLTVQEKKIAGFLIQGFSNGQIAQSIFISDSTVKNHISNIYKKFGVHSRQAFLVTLLTES